MENGCIGGYKANEIQVYLPVHKLFVLLTTKNYVVGVKKEFKSPFYWT